MTAPYTQNAQGEQALKLFQLFQEINMAGMSSNAKTFAKILPACTNLTVLEGGMFVQTALINMYAKGGKQTQHAIYLIMPQRDTILGL